MTVRPSYALVGVLLLSLCTAGPAPAQRDSQLAERVEAASGGAAWNARSAVRVPLRVEFGGKTILDGVMTTDTAAGRSRFEIDDGTLLVFDGESAWVSPEDAPIARARFHVLTWPYFLAAPMKLDDPGVHLEALGPRPFLDGEPLEAARLTFDAGTGDTPDDWYVVYLDADDRLAGMAYIVTWGKSVEEAEKEPHAIVYRDRVDVDGVSVPTLWTFHHWSLEEGVTGEPIGRVELGTARFVEPDAGTFDRPSGPARREGPPG
ncbi:MAG: hypothetical protein R2991_12565 [Thermoanaerobaculia bacterium]